LKTNPWFTLGLPDMEQKMECTDNFKLMLMERYMCSLANWMHQKIFDKMVTYPLDWIPGFEEFTLFKDHTTDLRYYEWSQKLGLDYSENDFYDGDENEFQRFCHTRDMWS